jgi:hypothetical protein
VTLAGFWCLFFRSGGAYDVIGRDWVPGETVSQDSRPPRTGYYRRYEAICRVCGKDIMTHL